MKKITSAKTVLSLAALGLTCLSFNSAAMDTYMETALVDVCKAAQSNSLVRYNKTSKSYRLKDKTIALKVMCNGEDIITFAENAGAFKTAAKLQGSLGNVDIIDVAKNHKLDVRFEE
jgi:hypothetical protein